MFLLCVVKTSSLVEEGRGRPLEVRVLVVEGARRVESCEVNDRVVEEDISFLAVLALLMPYMPESADIF